MIIKGGARGAAGNLAAHLERVDTNEAVSIIAIEGLAATSIKEALHEIDALSCGTQCSRSLYHASLSPQPGEAELTAEQKARAVEVLAAELGLTGQPHIIVEHTKTGASGINRTHQHVIWSRVDENGKTLSDWNNYPAHERAARAIERENGHQVTPGVFNRPKGSARPERTPSAVEWQQADRSRLDPNDAKELLTGLWQQSDSGAAFVAAADDQGFAICRGDKRGFVVLDPAGEIVTLSRRLPDTAAMIAQRMPERESLPTVDEARAAREAPRTVAEEAPQIAVEASPAVEAMDVAAERAEAAPGLAETPREPATAIEDEPFLTPYESQRLDSQEWREATQDSASALGDYRSQGADRFSDEKPIPPQEVSPAAELDKATTAATSAAGRVVGMIAGAVSKVLGDLLDFMFGSAPTPPTAPKKLERQALPSLEVAAPTVREKAPAEPLTLPPRPSQSFLEAMTKRLSAEDLARIEAAAAERAKLREMPHDQRRDRGFER